MESKLFVGGLSWATTEDALKDLFSQAGTVVSVVIITDRFSGKSRGFGFVEMSSEEEAEKAIEMFNGQEFEGRKIVVSKARPKTPRQKRFRRNKRS
jgi:RNA recognition motif-containing protein